MGVCAGVSDDLCAAAHGDCHDTWEHFSDWSLWVVLEFVSGHGMQFAGVTRIVWVQLHGAIIV